MPSKKMGAPKMRVIFFNLLKTHIEKMSAFCLTTILMKTNELSQFNHDVDENTYSYKFPRKRLKVKKLPLGGGGAGARSTRVVRNRKCRNSIPGSMSEPQRAGRRRCFPRCRSDARVHGREPIERLLVHLPVRHEFNARVIFHQIRNGFVLWYKRLEEGVFKVPRAEGAGGSLELRASELAMILDGIDVSKLQRLPRYERGGR